MAEEIMEAVQIIRVAYEGIEIAIRIGSGGLNAAQRVVETLIGLFEYEKTMGKTNMKNLLMKGGDLQVFQFKTDDKKQVEKMLKKYGILYSVLPDINKTDGLSEIIFHSEAVPRMNQLAKKLTHAKIATFDDYVNGGDVKGIEKLLKFLQGQKKGNALSHTEEDLQINQAVDNLIQKVGMFATEKQEISVEEVRENFSIDVAEAENVLQQLCTLGLLDASDTNGKRKVLMDKQTFENRLQSYRTLADRIQAVAKSKDASLEDVTISKTLIVAENDRAVKTRIPGTWGDNVRYLWISKENIMDIHEGKTMLTFLDSKKDYKLYDKENRVVETKQGQALYQEHYDRVEAGVRERYEKAVKEAEKTVPKKTQTKKRTQKRG